MRVLFTFMGGNGHVAPLMPVARAARAAGHSVAFGCGHGMAPVVEHAGFEVFRLGAAAGTPPERMPLRPVDLAREEQEFRDRFADRATRSRLPHTLALCQSWQPDVLVCDEADFGGVLAAELYGIPAVVVLVLAAGTFVRADLVGPVLNAIRADYGLDPDPDLRMLSRDLVLSPVPARYRDPRYPLPHTTHFIRPYSVPDVPGAMPLAVARPGAPTVYFTLGTIFNTESGDLFARVIDAVSALPVNLIVTVGNEIDPDEFGPQPAHVIIRQFIPQHELLPHCDALISHAGSGSVLGALAHGLPMVALPMGADQPLNAARCAKLGVAVSLDPLLATGDTIRHATQAVLFEEGFRRAARAFRDEIATMPPPESAVALLEQLTD